MNFSLCANMDVYLSSHTVRGKILEWENPAIRQNFPCQYF